MKHCPVCDREFEEGTRCPDDGSVLIERQERPDPLLGVTLKETYRVEEKLGEGGMGAVYRAVQTPLMRSVAVKVIKPSEASGDDSFKRFYREAKLLSGLSHPNIVQLHDFGNTADGLVFFVMEHLAGADLADAVAARKPLPLAQIGTLVEQMCAGVGAAHAVGLVHRDLKPANIFLARTSDGGEVVKVLDFGIAKSEDPALSRLTQTGAVVGTVGFIAPEVITGEAEATAVSDVYALGAIFYFMLTGRLAYDGSSAHAILVKQISEPPQPIGCELLGYPPAFEEVARRALAIKPAERYQSASALAQAVRAAISGGAAAITAQAPGIDASGETSQLETAAVEPPTAARSGVVTRTMAPATPAPLAPPTPTPAPIAPGASGRQQQRRLGPWIGAAVLGLGVVAAVIWRALAPGGHAAVDPPTSGAQASDAALLSPAADLPQQRGVSHDRIWLGLSAAISGPAREKGRAIRAGVLAAMRAVNDAGGVHGRQLELVVRDDGYDAERAEKNARELIGEEQVFALIGNQGSGPAAQVAALAPQEEFVLFGACTGTEALELDPPARYVFNVRPRYSEEAVVLVEYLVGKRHVPVHRIALFAQEGAYGDEVHDDVVRELGEQGHPDPTAVLTARYPHNTAEVDQAAKLLLRHRAKVDAVVMVALAQPAARLIKTLRDQGMAPIFASVSGVDVDALQEELRAIAPSYAAGIIVTQVVPPLGSEATGVRRFREHMQRYAQGEPLTHFSLEGYLAGQIFAEGLRRAGRALTTEALVDALEAMQGFDLGTGMICGYSPSQHQCSSKVWGSVLDENVNLNTLALE